MLGVLRSLRDTVLRFGMNSQLLAADAIIATKTITVVSTRRFFEGDQIVIRNDVSGEIRVIDKIIDGSTMTITEDLIMTWTVAEGSKVEKAFGDQYLKRVYLGDPDVIPDYPAITITADNRDENWWTINSTTAKWNCTISVLYLDDGLERTYESMLEMTASIEKALWANRFPVFDTLVDTTLTADASAGDTILSVTDTSGMNKGHLGILEDYDYTDHITVNNIVNATTFETLHPIPFDVSASRGGVVLIPSRWVMWTYPPGTTYGYIHKGSMLKAAQIKWFAQEEIVRLNDYTGPVRS
jgi:hypothetical protein